jgi:hypothetical protein
MPTRLLREGILDSTAVNALSFPAEVFYRRLMSVVDDFGRFDGRAAVLRSRLYPLKVETVREADIPRWIAECEKAGLIALYAVDGKQYILFHKLGPARAKESKFPPPPPGTPVPNTHPFSSVNGCAQPQTDANGCAQTRADVPYSGSGSGASTDSSASKDPPNPPRTGGPEEQKPSSRRAPKPRDPGGESVPLPAELDSPDFAAAWKEWTEYRRKRRPAVTAEAGQQQLESLRLLGPEQAAACLRASIKNQWQGIFPEKFRASAQPRNGFMSHDERVMGQIEDARGQP